MGVWINGEEQSTYTGSTSLTSVSYDFSSPTIVSVRVKVSGFDVDCTNLPESLNGSSFPKGCPGAVWQYGDPSQAYCTNSARSPDAHREWYPACCEWRDNSCQPKS